MGCVEAHIEELSAVENSKTLKVRSSLTYLPCVDRILRVVVCSRLSFVKDAVYLLECIEFQGSVDTSL